MLPLLTAVAGLLVLFRVWVPGFLAPDNMLDLTQQISVNAIIAFGMTLVILTGGIDLSVGALVALVGTTTVFGLIALGGTRPRAFRASWRRCTWTFAAPSEGPGDCGASGQPATR